MRQKLGIKLGEPPVDPFRDTPALAKPRASLLLASIRLMVRRLCQVGKCFRTEALRRQASSLRMAVVPWPRPSQKAMLGPEMFPDRGSQAASCIAAHGGGPVASAESEGYARSGNISGHPLSSTFRNFVCLSVRS